MVTMPVVGVCDSLDAITSLRRLVCDSERLQTLDQARAAWLERAKAKPQIAANDVGRDRARVSAGEHAQRTGIEERLGTASGTNIPSVLILKRAI